MKYTLSFLTIALVLPFGTLYADDPTPSPWSGSGEVSFVSTSGNTDTETLGLGFGLTYKPGVWTTELKAGFLRSESDGEKTAEKATGLLGVRRAINDHVDAYARTSYLRNKFAGVNSNVGIEAGGLYKALRGEKHVLDLTAGLGYTTEDRVSEENRDFAMATLGAGYKWKISETTDLTNDFGSVYDFDDSENWRLANTTALATSINKIFSLKVSYAINYQNQPSVGFEKRDTVASVALVTKF